MFKLLRFYSAASFVAVLGTAVLIGLFYRHVAIQEVMHLAQRNNLALAHTALNLVRPSLMNYLEATTYLEPDEPRRLVRTSHAPPPEELAHAIQMLMYEPSVYKVKIYNQHGVVAFSTDPTQIGRNQRHNPGFVAAINGRVADTLIYRDTFNSFDEQTEDDNLMQTYIPIRASATQPVRGVFEIYTDVNDLVRRNERTEFIIMAGALIIMSALYAVLLLVVRRARNIIALQHQTIRERTETLEILSAQMLKNEESQKKKIAVELHEGLAQTLSAIKLNLENSRPQAGRDDTVGRPLAAIIPALQGAIEEIRTIATELRPSSLDDFGLLPTISSLGRTFQQAHPGIRFREAFALQEHDIPPPLKVILYRITVLALGDIAHHSTSDQVLVALQRDHETLSLTVDDTPANAADVAPATLVEINPRAESRFAQMLELTTLSGGSFAASRPAAGRTLLRAAWRV